MKLLFLHTWANCKKSKRSAISLFLIIFLSALFLNLGIVIISNFGKFFDRRSNELNAPHYTVLVSDQDYHESYEEDLKNFNDVTKTEVSDVYYAEKPLFQYNHADNTIITLFFNWDQQNEFTKHQLFGEALPKGEKDIYLPYLFKISGGYNLGDDFPLQVGGYSYTFRVAGFTEDIVYGSILGGGVGFYLPKESYHNFITAMNPHIRKGVLLSARLTNGMDADNIILAIRNGILAPDMVKVWDTNYATVKKTRTMTSDIGSMIIVGFASFIVMLGIVIIHFRISNSIEDDMPNLGVMKAMGYTSRQVRLTLQLQFMCIAMFAGISGIALSYAGAYPISHMFAAQTGVIWNPKFDLVSSLETLGILLLAVYLVTLTSTRSIKKLHPVTALRNGILTHSFRNNYVPLNNTILGLIPALSIKTMIRNLRQNLMIFITVVLVTLISVFAIVMFYNIALKGSGFLDMIGMEYNDVQVTFDNSCSVTKVMEEIKEMPQVEKAWYGEQDYDVSIHDEDAMILAIEDPQLLDNNLVYKGRPPVYDNEISINGILAKQIGKEIGSSIIVKKDEVEREYLITGFQNSASYLGRDSMMTTEGYLKLVPDCAFSNVSIYLKEGEDTKDFIDTLNQRFGSAILFAMNNQAMMNASLQVYVLICSMISYLIMMVSFLVIVLILYLLIHSMVIKGKKELGIQKALGYTNKQLRMQISLSILPVTFVAAVIGCLVSALSINKIIAILFRTIGVMKAEFIVPVFWIVGLCILICTVAFAVSMWVSHKLKKITVYTLVIE